MQKGENVPFNKNKKDKIAQKTSRKSVDLDDLKKTLEESLGHKPTGEALEKKDQEKNDSKEELSNRIEEEKYEDKASFPNPPEKK
jgi:benzoyl-CoA reductase/2-hydroxyglutaryl-CoA dehydratase subunit BcrC/BadD/HgdB